MKWRIGLQLLLFSILILGFQNCSQPNSVSQSSSSPSIAQPNTQEKTQVARAIYNLSGGFILKSSPQSTIKTLTIPVSNTPVKLVMQSQGNLVLYNGNTAVFASNFYPNLDIPPYSGSTGDLNCGNQKNPCYAAFQTDGNLVLYNPECTPGVNCDANHAYWATGTGGHAPGQVSLGVYSNWLSINGPDGTALWPESALSYSGNSYFVNLPAGAPSCNAVAWDQVPAGVAGYPNLFIGRQNACSSGQYMSLTLASMNWNTHALSVVNPNLFPVSQSTPQKIVGNYYITTAYDPTLLYAHGELWVAFECSDRGNTFATPRLGAVACMGPINTSGAVSSWRVIASRTTVVVQNSNDGKLCHSASAPKIFFFHGLPYMYYTAIHMAVTNTGACGAWQTASTWGIELQNTKNQPGGLFWAASEPTLAPINSATDPKTVEVMQVDPHDPLSNQVADGFGVYTVGAAGSESAIIMTGALGGNTNLSCVKPAGLEPASQGCYRQFIAKATSPLGQAAFNYARVSETQKYMPSGLSQYVRRFYDNKGQSMVWGAYSPSPASDPYNRWTGPSETMWAYPLDLATLDFQSTYVEYPAGSFQLTPGQKVNLANGFLWYQPQGNLVLYNSYNTALWTSATTASQTCSNCLSIFQSDGNFVQYENGAFYWQSNTPNRGEYLFFGINPYIFHAGIQSGAHQWIWNEWGLY